MKCYFDTSAYVKLFSPEPGSEMADRLFRMAMDNRIEILMSFWTINEAYAAIDKKYGRKEITIYQRDKIWASIQYNMLSYAENNSNIGLLPVDIDILKKSLDLIKMYRLSADDALHLYSAYMSESDYFLCHEHRLITRTQGRVESVRVLDISDQTSMNSLMKELSAE